MQPFRDFLYPTRVDFDWSSICTGALGLEWEWYVRTRCEKGWEFWGEDVDGELERPDPELMTNAKPRSIDQLEWNERGHIWGFPKRHLHDACL